LERAIKALEQRAAKVERSIETDLEIKNAAVNDEAGEKKFTKSHSKLLGCKNCEGLPPLRSTRQKVVHLPKITDHYSVRFLFPFFPNRSYRIIS